MVQLKINKQSRRTADIVIALLVIISLASFTISYHTLVQMAILHGFPAIYAFLWPLSLDLFMITSCLVTIRRSLLKANTTFSWLTVLLTTVGSIGFNVASVWGESPLTMAMYAVPPLTVFMALEMLISLVLLENKKATVRRRPSRVSPKKTEP